MTNDPTVAAQRWQAYAEKMEAELKAARLDIAATGVDLLAMTTARDGYAQTVQRQQDQVTALQLQVREYEARVDRLSAELEDTTARLGTLQAANAALQTEVDRWRAAAGGKVPVDPEPDPQPDPEPDPDPRPRPDPGGDEPWTFAWFGKSAAEKKNARPPGWVDQERPTQTSGYIAVPSGSDIDLRDIAFELPTYTQKAISNGAKANADHPNVKSYLENLWITEGHDGLKWLSRKYNLSESVIRNTVVIGRMTERGRVSPMEHDHYDCIHGSTLVEGKFASGLGGKGGCYFAYRPLPAKGYPAQNLEYTERPEHIARGNVVIDCEMDATRGSYSFSYFDSGSHEYPSTIYMDDNVIVSEWDVERPQGTNDYRDPGTYPASKGAVRTCGAFMASNFVVLGRDVHTLERFTMVDHLIHLTQGRHLIGGVRDAKHVEFRGSVVETTDHLNPNIDINGRDAYARGMTPPESVTITNCLSNGANLRVWEADGTPVVQPIHTPGKSYIYTRATRRFMEV